MRHHQAGVVGLATSCVASFLLVAATAAADLSVAKFCELAIDLQELQVTHLSSLISLASEYSDNPETFLEEERGAIERHDLDTDALYQHYGTTAKAYLTFLAKHKREYTEYLDSNSNIRQEMTELRTTLASLLEQYESARHDLLGGSAE